MLLVASNAVTFAWYDRLAATVLVIGVIGFALDLMLQQLIQRLSWLRQE